MKSNRIHAPAFLSSGSRACFVNKSLNVNSTDSLNILRQLGPTFETELALWRQSLTVSLEQCIKNDYKITAESYDVGLNIKT